MTQAARTAFGEGHPLAEAYVQILATRGIEWGLIGPREADRLWDRHVLNSLAMVPFVPDGATVVDVGSGAGLPGIPLAIARPDLTVTLLEPLLRRFNFLVEAVAELGLGDRVAVVRGRAEEHKATYDVVTCRAVAPLERLVGWCAPLFLPAGELLAQKGSSAQAEVDAASADLRRRHLTARVLEAGGDTFIVRVRPTR
ncbi:MAG: 16S rRNA (guanine(527)-N(7))-methyltransferase RsmG [Propionibacteriaceae bacterium]|jgi:16S rRNA (guanine527-N7)-methyltransferase|nr:16S rRNA (guanine(527)-N(7))-methyltransferase RsmG [Micropruina sp.]HBX81176.1 16S rRNA (guanine(527)-N(7))-methyltransferase RsmG [Propionibacteriaceae bacterium]HBY24300.1 16S rRNA (guanine(527)-N(7))-methyltransferase RsmG [Propionibacteriaceae bacterium]